MEEKCGIFRVSVFGQKKIERPSKLKSAMGNRLKASTPMSLEQYIAECYEEHIKNSCDTFEDLEEYFLGIGVISKDSFNHSDMRQAVLNLLQIDCRSERLLTILLWSIDWDKLEVMLGYLYDKYM
jgi:hypothetical protein